ncbi:MAG: glycosyltransferase family 4 protein [Deltaproteobacteria bacterium]|nr:glycosyltransferase family 4 protein [Candidatus Anaeroferrophillus wilburensis]MBN2889632.1 glycosyltransferase family 4 protein [Deltaproteobacteria bacterium]
MTSVHQATDVRIFVKECRSLSHYGWKVTLIAPHDRQEEKDGVTIVPVAQPAHRWQRMTALLRQSYLAALRINAPIYHLHDPELIPVGILLRLRGKIVIYDVHENLALQIRSKDWIPSWAKSLLSLGTEVLENAAALFFDGIVAATPSIGHRFPAAKTTVVQNFPFLMENKQEGLSSTGKDFFPIMYVGRIAKERGAFEMLETLDLLGDPTIKLLMAGNVASEALLQMMKRHPGWHYVDFRGWLNHGQVQEMLGKGRIGLVILHPEPNYLKSYPIKLFEYMAAGIPVIASDFPLWRSIVEKASCGLLVDRQNPAAIARAIRWLMAHPQEAAAMGKRGRQAVEEHYNWPREERKLLALYDRLAAGLDNLSTVKQKEAW